MLTLRSAFIAHLMRSGILETARPLATKEDLAKKGVPLPAAFVTYPGGHLGSTERGELHLFVPGFSQIGDETDAATDALGLTEDLARWLEAHWRFASEETGTCYHVLFSPEEGLRIEAGRFRDKHAFYLVRVPVAEE